MNWIVRMIWFVSSIIVLMWAAIVIMKLGIEPYNFYAFPLLMIPTGYIYWNYGEYALGEY